jgi:hypothetical protein
MAPSGDDQPGRTPPKDKKLRGTRKRKPGKQPGAPGAHLAWNDDPDDTVPHFPAGACECPLCQTRVRQDEPVDISA